MDSKFFRIATMTVTIIALSFAGTPAHAFKDDMNRAASETEAIAPTGPCPEMQTEAMLAMDLGEFDQPDKGWRSLASIDGCEKQAAELLAKYRKANAIPVTLLFFHEGQMLAYAGETEAAIRKMELSKKRFDVFGWNPYVDATIAFLRKDRRAFAKHSRALRNFKKPSGEYIITDDGDLMPRPAEFFDKLEWPQNMKVLDALSRCFESSYKDAYGNADCFKQ